eukprot:1160615-Pelagomonas_calceolata.AAC.1
MPTYGIHRKKHPDTKLLIPKQPLDLASQDSIQRFTDEINSEYRQLDVLINNAGISHVEEPYTKEGIGALAQDLPMAFISTSTLFNRPASQPVKPPKTFGKSARRKGNSSSKSKRSKLPTDRQAPKKNKLVASHARVVTVSSISHRMATIKDEKHNARAQMHEYAGIPDGQEVWPVSGDKTG